MLRWYRSFEAGCPIWHLRYPPGIKHRSSCLSYPSLSTQIPNKEEWMTPIIKHPRKRGCLMVCTTNFPDSLSLPRLTNWQPLPIILVKSTMVRINIQYRWIWTIGRCHNWAPVSNGLKIWALRLETYALPPFFMNPKHFTGIVKIYMNMKVINSYSNKRLYNTYYIYTVVSPHFVQHTDRVASE